jgi:UPF0176 protein
MNQIVICSFYKFVRLQDAAQLRAPLLAQMQAIGIKGTLILANEGINGGFAGTREQMDAFYAYLHALPHFDDLNFKETFDEKNPFEKSKVKLRKEIVSLGMPEVEPKDLEGTHLSPEQWNELLQDPEVVLIDTRNDYEYELGTFKNAINPDIEHFRDFPDYVAKNLNPKKDKKIAMFCTGGIRCEKTTAFMREQGFQYVYFKMGF